MIAAISVAVWLLCIVFGGILYETNDDTAMNLMAAGAYGDASQYLVYTNILMGWMFKILYGIFPGVNVYLWTYLLLNLFSVILICMVLTDRMNTLPAVFTAFLFNLLLANDLYINIQYTKNSALYTCVGALLIALFISKKGNLPRLIAASAMLGFGLCTRFNSFLMAVPFAALVILYALIDSKPDKKTVISLALPVIVCAICFGTHVYNHYLDPNWRDYHEFNDIMTEKVDYGNYNFNWAKDEYLEAGFTEWDFKLLDVWMWNDSEYFSLDKIKTMKEIGDNYKVSGFRIGADQFKETFSNIGKNAKSVLIADVSLALVAIALLAAIIKKKWKALPFIIVSACFTFGELYYLVCLRRVEWRVEFIAWTAGMLAVAGVCMLSGVMNSADSEEKRPLALSSRPVIMAAMAVICIVSAFIWQKNNLDYKRTCFNPKTDSSYEHIQDIHNADGFFVLSIDEMGAGYLGAKNIFEIDRSCAGLYSNMTQVGGWEIFSPLSDYYGNMLGISDCFKALVERDDVYYVGNGERMGYLLMWLNEKYGPDITVTEVEFDGFSAWKFIRQ